MSEESFIEKQEENISNQIFSVSACMIGVCFTVINLIHISVVAKGIETLGDELTALDAVIFVLACFMSYVAIKTKNRKRRLYLEKLTDGVFLSGLLLMVFVCIFVVYTFSLPIQGSRAL